MASLRERALARTPPAYRIGERAPDQGGRETSLSIERRGAADRLVPIINGNGGLPALTRAWGAKHSKSSTIGCIQTETSKVWPASPSQVGRGVPCADSPARPTPTAATGL